MKKLFSRVTDNFMNTSPRLVRKYPRIYVRSSIWELYSCSYIEVNVEFSMINGFMYKYINIYIIINPPLRLCQIREHVRKTYLLKKLLSGVSDTTINTSPVWCEDMHGYFSADTTKTFSACILIVIASLNCARKSRSFF